MLDGKSPPPASKDSAISAADSVARDLADMILTQMVPGSSLPSEAELATRYGVSRLTVREAVKLLAGRGLLDLGRGRRALVREPDGSVFADFLTAILHNDSKSLFDLIEVRFSLEMQSATLAAKRGNRAGLTAIESALERMRQAALLDTPESEIDFHDADIGFHEAVALASGNRVLGYLFEAMSAPLRNGVRISRHGQAARGHTIHDTIDAHQLILDAIRSGNGRAAGEAMRVHLKDTESDIRAALASMTNIPRR
jgi:GntR family transcriptional repressor for pyruvate dehydrogenase complex